MSHYYYYDKKTKSNEKEISSTVNNNKYLFITDNGVFSKNKIDFGTRLLLNEIDIDGPRKIVDYGCGYGVIGIVLKKKYPEAQLFFVDSNKRAVELTKKNVINHKFDANVFQSESLDFLDSEVDLIVINPPIKSGKKNIFSMYDRSFRALSKNGSLYIVIKKKHGANSSEKYLRQIFSDVALKKKKNGYYIYKAIK